MSDYMFMLENHLNAAQNRVVSQVQQAATESKVNLFITGGAIRDMLGGFPIRDLDFVVEGDTSKLVELLTTRAGAKVVARDEVRNSYELVLPGPVTASVAMAQITRYPRIGAQPEVTPATIHEDLKCRDFTINAMALSLNPASKGLLIDPTNGQADLEQKELRAVSKEALYDDPARILRLVRFRTRFGFTLEPRTQQQYENARMEEIEKCIPPRKLYQELCAIATELDPAPILEALAAEKLLHLFSPALAGGKLNLAGLARLRKAYQTLGMPPEYPVDRLALFLYLLTEPLNPKEKAALVKALAMRKAEAELAEKLKESAKQLERQLKSAKIKKASQVYEVLHQVPGEVVMLTFLTTKERLVQDRIKNFFHKYLPAALEVTDKQVVAAGHTPGTTKFTKAKDEMIRARLDSRPRKAASAKEETPPPPAAEAPAARARKG